MLLDGAVELDVVVNTARRNEARAEKCVVPIEDDGCLVVLRLLLRGQPNLFVGES